MNQEHLRILLPLFFIILIGVALLLLLQWFDYRRLRKKSLNHIDQMSGFTFEKYLSVLFREQGYNVTVTPDSSDFGADLIISKNGTLTAVQAKRYGKAVGIHAVQEAIAAQHHYRCQKAMVVTNSTFTSSAWKLAMSTGVWLIDRNRLEKWVVEVKK